MRSVGSGVCDLHVHGGPKRHGVIEVKTISHGIVERPRGYDLAQVGAYARLIAGHGSFDEAFAAVAYAELESRTVRIYGVSNARQLVSATLELFRAA